MRGTFPASHHNSPQSFRPIQQLEPATQSRLRSTQILTSLPQIVSELVQNSLDAEARQVDIGVDCEEWLCWVRDDGVGIDRNGFDILAGGDITGRYGTSKVYKSASLDEVSTFGFRGEALASAADLSCLEVSSRTAISRQSWSVILKGGSTLYNGPSIRWRRESHGTVVSIRDAFYNLPIRRLSHPSPSRTIELIRKDIESFALVFPHVSFTLDNAHRSKDGGPGKGRILTIPKTSSSLMTFRHLYGKALAEHVEEINEMSGEMKLEGFISLNGAQSKAHQFLYINLHLMSPCDLHRIIDSKFSMSSFAKHAFDEEGETSQPRPATRRSPRKTEKKPVYVLNLSIPPRHVDNCLEPAKAAVQLQNTEAAISFLSNVVEAFLVRHAFLVPRTARQRLSARQMSGDDPSPRKRRKVTREKELDWLEMLNRPGPSTLPDSRNVQNRAESSTSPLVVRPEAHSGDMDTDAQFKTTWTDPATGEVFVVDTRTGNSYPVHARQDHNNLLPHRRTLVTSATRGSTQHSTPKTGSMPDWIKDALESNETYALPESRIPALSLSSKFAADTHKAFHPSLHQRDSRRDEYGARRTHRDSWRVVGAAPTRPGRFDKEALRRAQILGQVDRKFIACVVNCEDDHQRCGGRGKNGKGKGKDRGRGRALVLIDQHAADERIRVERFLSELCLGFLHEAPGDRIELDADADPEVGVLVKDLVPPVPVLLAPHEAERLSMEETQMAFRRWGINFVGLNELQLPDNDIPVGDAASGERGYTQVMVSSVPEVVGEKLLAGDELQNLIKGYLAKLETEGPLLIPNSQPLTQEAVGGVNAGTGDARWQKAMRWCPRELHELVNSKACRGAIMFNDSLSVAQCTRLVRDLADTAFPFQCAHGRPSLVPLADLGAEQSREDYRTSVYTSRPVDWCQFGLSGG